MIIKEFQDSEKVGESYCITVFKHEKSQAGLISYFLNEVVQLASITCD